ncbi:MAG TPA: two-component regulator propeller domain-containing protein [Balneolaceae bacterium]|nr:two-component regulator propeller domain-containing protein [Balneolaceae bacterium]
MGINPTNRYQKPVALFIFLFLFSGVAAAQSGSETYRHISTGEGLSNGQINDMLQDRHGFIWVGTNAGLDRYDGYSFTNYRNDPATASTIMRGPVRTLLEDGEGRIWSGSSGLNIFTPATKEFITVKVQGSIPEIRLVNDLLKEIDGDIWAGTTDGLYYFPKQEIVSDTLETTFFPLPTEDEVPAEIKVIERAADGSIWVATSNNLFNFDTVSEAFSSIPEPDSNTEEIITGSIQTMLLDSSNTLWIGSANGLAEWESASETPTRVARLGNSRASMIGRSVQSITQDPSGNIWIGTGNIGAFRYSPSSGDVKAYRAGSVSDDKSLAEDNIQTIFTDQDGNLWFGYRDFGLTLVYSQSWNYSFTRAAADQGSSQPANFVQVYKEDSEGNGWMATHKGLAFYPADGGSIENFFLNPFNPLMVKKNEFVDLIVDDQFVYIITLDRDLMEFNRETERFDWIRVPFVVNQFDRILGTDTHIYVGSATDGLFVVNKETREVQHYPNTDNNTENSERKGLYPNVDVNGDVYVQAVNSLYPYVEWDLFKFDTAGGEFSPVAIDSPDGLTDFRPLQVSEIEPGVLWGVFGDGILKQNALNGQNSFYFQTYMSTVDDVQPGILEDDNGYLWLGSSTGIMRMSIESGSVDFFEADPGNKPDFFKNPVLLMNGDIVFSGNGGFTRFNPDDMEQDDFIQSVKITELWSGADLFNTLYDGRGEYEFDHDANNISISYIGLNYKDPIFTRYRYRLLGYDDQWNEVGVQKRVFFANLPPGDYTFEVQAARQFGSFSSDIATLQVSISPPWWQTFPAYIAFVLLFVGGVVGVDRVQKKRVLSKERERTREKELAQAKEIEKAYTELKAAQTQLVQQEKLASLGQLTAGIAHEIKNPLNFVNNFSDLSIELIEEVKEEFEKLQIDPEKAEDADEIMELLDDIEANQRKIFEHGSRADGIVKSMLQHSRGGSGDMESEHLNSVIKEYVNLAFHGMRANPNPINVEIITDLDETVGEIRMVREDFSRVVLNLCNNAFDAMRDKSLNLQDDPDIKYYPKLSVKTEIVGNKVHFTVADNGPGIPDEIKDKIMQPFFTTKRGTEGTGLGLSITNDIISAHGGTITINSNDTEGEGTEFQILLPIK